MWRPRETKEKWWCKENNTNAVVLVEVPGKAIQSMWWWCKENNENAVVAAGENNRMWWWWWWWKGNNKNAVVLVKVAGKNKTINVVLV